MSHEAGLTEFWTEQAKKPFDPDSWIALIWKLKAEEMLRYLRELNWTREMPWPFYRERERHLKSLLRL